VAYNWVNMITIAKMAKTYPTNDFTHNKTETKNQKIFFVADSKTCHIFWGFEQLSGAISRGVMKLQSDNLLGGSRRS